MSCDRKKCLASAKERLPTDARDEYVHDGGGFRWINKARVLHLVYEKENHIPLCWSVRLVGEIWMGIEELDTMSYLLL